MITQMQNQPADIPPIRNPYTSIIRAFMNCCRMVYSCSTRHIRNATKPTCQTLNGHNANFRRPQNLTQVGPNLGSICHQPSSATERTLFCPKDNRHLIHSRLSGQRNSRYQTRTRLSPPRASVKRLTNKISLSTPLSW